MKAMKVITITLNPAYDIHCIAPNLALHKETFAEIESKGIGGKGVNISRALKANGRESTAVVVVGSSNAAEFCRALEEEQIDYIDVWTEGRIRQNLTFYMDGAEETRISFNGFACDETVLAKIAHRIGEVDERTIVTVSGAIPQGIRIETMKEWLLQLKAKGVKLAVDSRSFSFADLVELQPWLIKPNAAEAKNYFGAEFNGTEDAVACARKASAFGIENVILSLGADGAVYANAKNTYRAAVPTIQTRSTIGAGDSLIAGFIAGYTSGEGEEAVFRRAVAYGVAACLEKGTLPPKAEQVNALLRDITVTKIS